MCLETGQCVACYESLIVLQCGNERPDTCRDMFQWLFVHCWVEMGSVCCVRSVGTCTQTHVGQIMVAIMGLRFHGKCQRNI